MLKRLSACLLALIWALTLTACGYSDVQADFVFTNETAAVPSAPVSDIPSQVPASGPPAETEQAESPTEAEQLESPAGTEQAESQPSETQAPAEEALESEAPAVDEDGWYSSKEEVALYIHLYGHLPDNYVTKREAQNKGWTGGSVERYIGEGTAIGGSRFGNYEGLLPEKEGRTYTECDIGTVGAGSRGGKRIVFSSDGLIYYTGDHYQSFELLYGEE